MTDAACAARLPSRSIANVLDQKSRIDQIQKMIAGGQLPDWRNTKRHCAPLTVDCHLQPRISRLDISTPLKYVKGVGPARAEMLETKGLVTVEDLLAYAPFRYEDRTNIKTIAQLAPGEMATVVAGVESAHLRGFRRRNLGLFEAIFKDASKERLLGKWFHGGYLVD